MSAKRYLILLTWIAALLWVVSSCKHDPIEPPITDGGGNGGGGGTGGGGGGSTLPPCDPDTVYFTKDILPFLVSNCAISGCHDAASAQDGVILTDYNNIMQTGDVRPFDLDGSDLFEVITEDDLDKRMPPYPEYEALSAAEINMIATWIMQGALNNTCAADCDTSNVTYAMSIEPIISAKCQGCHSGSSPQGGLSLTNYGQVSSEALFGTLLDAVQHTGTATPMPYNSTQLPDCEIDLIRIWIENGAPE